MDISFVHLLVVFHVIKSCRCNTEYVIADGIRINKLDFESAQATENKKYIDLKSEERLLEYRLQMKEKKTERNQFPNRCHGKLKNLRGCLLS